MGFQANINKITELDERFKPSFYSHSTPEEIQEIGRASCRERV